MQSEKIRGTASDATRDDGAMRGGACHEAAGPVALRASALHCLDDPAVAGSDAIEYIDDALLLIDEGHVRSLQPFTAPPPGYRLIERRGCLLVPGFIDTHVHYPQVDVLARHGTQLLDWLERYTFPTELRFADKAHATEIAEVFLDQLLLNGTTTALVFATVHPQSVDAFFEAASARHLRMITGKVLMDRHAPDALLDTPASAYDDSDALIQRWHGRDRLRYAVTPRFAPTSTSAQLDAAARLLDAHDDLYLHTHLAENDAECRWVAELFPEAGNYLDVYARHGLLRRRSVFAHAIHLDDHDWSRIAAAGAAIAHCPTSNLFIGSGLFPLPRALDAGVRVGLGTDVGGGDSFSLLRTLNEAYKVQQLQGFSMTPEQGLYLATLGGARALWLDDYIGNFTPGKEADFVLLDDAATPLLAHRRRGNADWRERLFMLQMLGDDRCIESTWVLGRPAWQRDSVDR